MEDRRGGKAKGADVRRVTQEVKDYAKNEPSDDDKVQLLNNQVRVLFLWISLNFCSICFFFNMDLFILQNHEKTVVENHTASDKKIKTQFNQTLTSIKVNFEIDLLAVVLLVAGVATRFYRLEEPRSIV